MHLGVGDQPVDGELDVEADRLVAGIGASIVGSGFGGAIAVVRPTRRRVLVAVAHIVEGSHPGRRRAGRVASMP